MTITRIHPAGPGSGAAVLAPPAEWEHAALCAQTDPELFHPNSGRAPAEAKRICSRCDAQPECLTWALAHETRGHDAYGVWGGLTVGERLAVLRRRGLLGLPGRRRREVAA